MKRTYVSGLLIAAVGLGYLLYVGHAQWVRDRPLLPINFDHQLHGKVNCLTCHHDYADHAPSPPTGERSCVLCHKKTPALAQRIEQDFHGLCRDCHLKQVQVIHAAGPVRECQRCHAVPALGIPQ